MEPILLLTEKMEVEKTFGNIKRVKHSRGITDDLARYFVYAVEHGQSVEVLQVAVVVRVDISVC